MRHSVSVKWTRAALEVLTVSLVIIFFFPIVLVILNSAKETSFLVTSNPLGPPERWGVLLENIKELWVNENTQYQKAFLNSVIITAGSLLFIVLSSSMAAWALVRRKSRASVIVFFLFVSALVVPFQVVMLPLVSWFRVLSEVTGVRWLRSYFGLIFAYIGFGAPLSIFLYHGFIKGIPYELEEAAIVDGCSKLQVYIRIILPMLKPITITILILQGIWIWNDFLLPLLVLGKGTRIQTVPLAVANYAGAFVTEWQLLLTAVLIAMAPVVVLFIFAQKYIIKGMVAGAIK